MSDSRFSFSSPPASGGGGGGGGLDGGASLEGNYTWNTQANYLGETTVGSQRLGISYINIGQVYNLNASYDALRITVPLWQENAGADPLATITCSVWSTSGSLPDTQLAESTALDTSGITFAAQPTEPASPNAKFVIPYGGFVAGTTYAVLLKSNVPLGDAGRLFVPRVGATISGSNLWVGFNVSQQFSTSHECKMHIEYGVSI